MPPANHVVIIVLSVNLSKSNNTKRYGRRLSVGDFSDPKTVEVKDNVSPTEIQGAPPMTEYNFPRPIDILALGGSMTWAGFLEDKFSSYPWLVGWPNYDHVDNLAIPEMGTPYWALCLESLIPDSDVKNYDVILLDFIDGEFEGFEWLLKRLRERFPEAVIIYVHLWPLRALIEDADGLRPDTLGLNPEVDWRWIGPGINFHKLHPQMSGGTRGAVLKYGGHFWHLQIAGSPKWAMHLFSDDWWHLSAEGHKAVATGLLEVLSNMKDDVFKPKSLGSFSTSDQCYNNFASESDSQMTNLPPNELSSVSSSSNSWYFELDPDASGTIQFESKFSSAVPVVIAYMSNGAFDAMYSTVEVSFKDQPPVTINPNHFYNPKYLSKVKYALAGQSTPGTNVLQINTVNRGLPFRIAGLFLNEDLENSKFVSTVKGSEVGDQSSGNHIVFCFFQPNPLLSKFKVDYDVVSAAVSTAVERLSPDWKIHAIVSDDDAMNRMLSLSNVEVVDYRNVPFSHLFARFQRTYIHQSDNDIEYEKFCMYRWIVISEYFTYLKMRGAQVNHIVAVDTDVFVLENPLLVDETIDWDSIQSYRIIDGAAIMWSLEGIQSFVGFLMSAYEIKENAVNLVSQWGSKMPCRASHSSLIPCFTDEVSGELVMWHMNDMYWYIHWVAENPDLRIRIAPEIRTTYSYNCHILRALKSGEKYPFSRSGTEILLSTGEAEAVRVCLVHFSWEHNKDLAVPFHSFLNSDAPEFLLISP